MPKASGKKQKISIIVPVFNEDTVIGNFVDTVQGILDSCDVDYELLFVNDGSRDNSLSCLMMLSLQNPKIRIVNLSRNFGKEAALTAGIDAAFGDAMIPMDVDLQDPPELIPAFLDKWREGYDVVYGIRASRDTDSGAKRTTAGWFYRVFNRIAQIDIPENVGDFRLIDRRVAEVLKRLPERNRFMKGLFAWVGFNSIGIPYARPARALGTTKWNYWKLWNFALDGLVGFSTTPLRVWTYIGFFVAAIAFLYAFFIILRVAFLGVDVPGYASLLTVILFIGGIQLISIGVIGEYLGRLFTETKRRPIYVIEGVYRNGAREEPEFSN